MNIKSVLVSISVTFLLASVSYAEGLADRASETWSSPTVVEHVHSIEDMQRGLMEGSGGLADRKSDQDAAIVIDHIHGLHGHTAAGTQGDYDRHSHQTHLHTVQSPWSALPDGLTAHQKKRIMFDNNGLRR